VRVSDASADGKSKSCSVGFGRHKWIEYFGKQAGRYAGARIGDLDSQEALAVERGVRREVYLELTAWCHRFKSIDNDIQKELCQLICF
jgi:hypothetical protein